jgi:phosphoglycolate phosphatase
MSSPRLIVFDLDGTLIDSRRDIADAANELLESCGAAPLDEHVVGRMVGNGAPALVVRAFAAAGLTPPGDALDRYLAMYDRRLLAHTRPYPGITTVLAALAARTRLALLTNKPGAATRCLLDGLDLSRYFADDAVVTGDGPFPRKPDPGGLQHLAAAATRSIEETVLVGDSAIDWRTARAAGASIWVARYGFGFDGFPLDLSAGDRVIDAPADLLGAL